MIESIKDAVTILNKEQKQEKIIYYDDHGITKSCFGEIPKNACAYEIGNILKAKVDSRNKFFNPQEDRLSDSKKGTNEEKFKFRETNRTAFNYYIEFLKHRQLSLLTAAQRNNHDN